MTTYSTSNSLSPMMFKKSRESSTRNERLRSRSMENIIDAIPPSHTHKKSRSTSLVPSAELWPDWSEISLVKSFSPVVACLLPALSTDFVCSALMAVGATPLITEDPDDLSKDLYNAKAVVVDVSAPRQLLERFLEEYEITTRPLIVIASQAGSNDRKRDLARQIISDCGPSVICGRHGDVYAVSQAVLESANGLSVDGGGHGILDSSSSDEERDRKTSVPVVVHDEDEHIPHAIRKKLRKVACRRSHSPQGTSPSPPRSHSPISPRSSPGHSPISPSPRGVRRKIEGKPVHRVNTALPMVHMKGQFRDCTMSEVTLAQALDQAQRLAAYTDAFVHLYETNVVTNGEMVAEITNNQVGMGNLHSTLACSGAICAAVLGCVEGSEDDVGLRHCCHALALHYIAGEEAASQACCPLRGTVEPGSLRRYFIDALHYLDEHTVHSKARIAVHMSSTSPQP